MRKDYGGYGGKGEEIIEERAYECKGGYPCSEVFREKSGRKLATVATAEKRFMKSVKEVIRA